MRYAFIDSEGTVVNVVSGALDEAQRAQFLRDYGLLFGATKTVAVDDGDPVWVGGSYDSTSGEFSPPPSPEPEPEPIVEEPINDDAPIE